MKRRDKHYTPGDYYIIDDIRGYKVRASEARLQWDQLLTMPPSFSPRQPQDLVTGVRDDQSVPLPRPRQANQFVLVGTWVTAFSARRSTTIQVASVVGFSFGQRLLIMLDTGENFATNLVGISGLTMTLSDPLPASVGGNYGDPIENSVLAAGFGINDPTFILDVPGHDILDVNVLA